MKRICAWCKKDLGDRFPGDDAIITHGICTDCARHLHAQMGMPLQEYLDGLDAPILLVDADGRVITANRRARAIVGKDLPQVEGFSNGDVFECANAALPGGCGHTVCCSGCAIRNAVMDTMHTGTGHLRSSAFLNHATKGNLSLQISTEKVGNVVLLRIDSSEAKAAHGRIARG